MGRNLHVGGLLERKREAESVGKKKNINNTAGRGKELRWEGGTFKGGRAGRIKGQSGGERKSACVRCNVSVTLTSKQRKQLHERWVVSNYRQGLCVKAS